MQVPLLIRCRTLIELIRTAIRGCYLRHKMYVVTIKVKGVVTNEPSFAAEELQRVGVRLPMVANRDMFFEVFQIETSHSIRMGRRRMRLRMRRLVCSSQQLRRLSNSRRLPIFSSRLRRRLLICSSRRLRRLLRMRRPSFASKHKTQSWRRCKMFVSY